MGLYIEFKKYTLTVYELAKLNDRIQLNKVDVDIFQHAMIESMLVIAKENMMSAIIEKVWNEKVEEGISAC